MLFSDRLFRADAPLILLPGATRFALAPGYHIPRLWRFYACPWLSYSAPLALLRLPLGYHIPRLWRFALAPGYHIPRLWRFYACPWLSHSAPSALYSYGASINLRITRSWSCWRLRSSSARSNIFFAASLSPNFA